jgi:hypothetical protein
MRISRPASEFGQGAVELGDRRPVDAGALAPADVKGRDRRVELETSWVLERGRAAQRLAGLREGGEVPQLAVLVGQRDVLAVGVGA